MKLTLVIDTEDPEGIADAHKVVSHFKRKYVSDGHPIGHKLTYGKIKHIKMLRRFAKAAIDEHTSGGDPAGLKFTKYYTDKLIKEDPDFPGI